MRHVVSLPIKMKLPTLNTSSLIRTLGICLISSAAMAQSDSSNYMSWLESFEIPRSERIDIFSQTAYGAPVCISSHDGNIFIRPMNTNTGSPKKTLAIRSNESKRIEQYQHSGDTLFALVRSVERMKEDAFEVVLYSIKGDSLAQLHRHRVELNELEGKKNTSPFYFRISPNGKRTLVVRQFGFSKTSAAAIMVEAYNTGSKKVNSRQLSLPFDADDVEILEAAVDDQGIVYLAAKTGIKLNSPFMRKYLIYTFNPRTKLLHEFDLSADKAYIQEVSLKVQPSFLQVLSLYSNDPFMQNESLGYAYVCIDSGGSIIKEKIMTAYSANMIANNRKGGETNFNSIEQLHVDQIFEINGVPLLLFDKRYRDQVCTTDPRTGIMTCTDQFHFEGINIENLADLSKSTTIKRKQLDYEKLGPYVDHQTIKAEDGIVVLYNDHYKNSSIVAEKVMNNPSRSRLRYVHYRVNGDIQTKFITDQKLGYVSISTVTGYHRDGKIYSLFSSGRDYKIGVANLDEIE